MTSMIDMHSHVLPGIDDGAKKAEESLKMLSESFRQGVKVCAATPHLVIHRQSDVEKFIQKRDKAYLNLKHAMENDGGEYPKIVLAGEVYLDNDLNRYEGLERICYTGTDYLLLEFPIDKLNPRWAEWIYDLNRKGINIVVAHVDRYPQWEKMMADFNGLSVKYQINASRFIKFADRKLLKKLLTCGNSYIVSSDMHNTTSRSCNMALAFSKAEKKLGEDAQKLFFENARNILGIS